MKFTLSLADCTGNKANTIYPHQVEISSAEQMQDATSKDHVCGVFTENKRSNANFEWSNVVVMDCDNEEDDPATWVSPEDLEDLIPDVSFVAVPSRNNMKEKDGKAARPKFHVYFPIHECVDADEYAAIKASIHRKYPFFDGNALDAARFIFGASAGDVLWHEDWEDILDVVEVCAEEDAFEKEEDLGGVIREGSRNNTMSLYAARVITRFGLDDGRAMELFLKRAAKCDPPLPDEELDAIWRSATKYGKKVQKKEGYIDPAEYGNDFDVSDDSLRPDDYSDMGQARAFLKRYEGQIVYSAATGFLRYSGKQWIENNEYAVGGVEEFLDMQLENAEAEVAAAKKKLIDAGVDESIIDAGGKNLEKAITGKAIWAYREYQSACTYRKFVLKRRDYTWLRSTMEALKPMVNIEVTDLDRDEFLLNTPEATYDLRKGMAGAQPHAATDLITKSTIVAPGDEGEEIWQDTLDLIFCGDKKLIAYVQEVVGMAAVGKVFAEQMIIAHGGGANGKSTFWNTIARVLGSYSGNLSAEALTMNCKRNVKPEMAEMMGKRLIIAAESDEGVRLNTSAVKQMCSTDLIYAEKKYKAPFSFVPSHLLVLYTNHLPKVGSSSDEGIWRRLIVVPFKAHITGSSDIKNYSEYLVDNAAPAILKWIIEGAQKAIDNGFRPTPPQCVTEAVEKYRQDNDWFGRFIDECCEVDPSFEEKSGDLYAAYRAYCNTTGDYTRSTTDFYGELEKQGFVRHRTNKGNYMRGVKLKEQNDFLN